MKREEQLVVKIENGPVIDHIPSSKLFEVINLLHLEEIKESAVVIGYNLESKKFGRKSLIKVFNKYFTDAELNLLSVVAGNVTLCIIKTLRWWKRKKS